MSMAVIQHMEAVEDERLSRQAQLIHPDAQKALILIVGCGMLGGWVAHTVARFAGGVSLFDMDVVEAANTGCQPYSANDIGKNKAEATEEKLLGLPVKAYPFRFDPDNQETRGFLDALKDHVAVSDAPVVFVSALDTMAGRRQMAKVAKDIGAKLFIDVRALGEVASVLAWWDDEGMTQYLKDLPSDDTVPEEPCGTRGTSYVGLWTGATVAGVINKFFAGVKPRPMTVFHVGMGFSITPALVEPLEVVPVMCEFCADTVTGTCDGSCEETINQEAAEAYIADGHPTFRA